MCVPCTLCSAHRVQCVRPQSQQTLLDVVKYISIDNAPDFLKRTRHFEMLSLYLSIAAKQLRRSSVLPSVNDNDMIIMIMIMIMMIMIMMIMIIFIHNKDTLQVMGENKQRSPN